MEIGTKHANIWGCLYICETQRMLMEVGAKHEHVLEMFEHLCKSMDAYGSRHETCEHLGLLEHLRNSMNAYGGGCETRTCTGDV